MLKGGNREYFEWLCLLVGTEIPKYSCYWGLLEELYLIDFRSPVYMDKNRALDGIALREKWADECGIRGDLIGDKPCSVLEMLVALSKRLEEDVIGDPKMMIFWEFLSNLGLLECSDDRFDSYFVDEIVENWLDRDLDFDGNGGICPLKRPILDQKNEEIWAQSMSYLNEKLGFL